MSLSCGGTFIIGPEIPARRTLSLEDKKKALVNVRQLNLTGKRSQGQIIHFVLLLDISGSMEHLIKDLVKLADSQVASLAASQLPDQEIRVTVLVFSNPQYLDGLDAKCLIYERDVLRMPSIAGMGITSRGGTALCGAMLATIADLKLTPEKYGDHSFLLYLLTDGDELHSTPQQRVQLPGVLKSLPDNWTNAAFVPNSRGKALLGNYGFAPGNISIWDPSQADAVDQVDKVMTSATTSYLNMRSSAPQTRSTTSLFEAAAPKVADLKKNLTAMTRGSYDFIPVTAQDLVRIDNGRIDEFMELHTGKPYFPGRTYYEFDKRETIQDGKKILVAILDKATNEEVVYTGSEVRRMLKLPESGTVRVRPGAWQRLGYKVFVLSTSNNRKLAPGSRLLVVR